MRLGLPTSPFIFKNRCLSIEMTDKITFIVPRMKYGCPRVEFCAILGSPPKGIWNWPITEFKFTYLLTPDEEKKYSVASIAGDVPLTEDEGGKDWEYITVTLLAATKDRAKAILEQHPTKKKDFRDLLSGLECAKCISWGEHLVARLRSYNVIEWSSRIEEGSRRYYKITWVQFIF